ncbi:uncharacterized protein BDZ99DRAFT_462176 [Mytilinidion resinicola]|uniref:WD40 repeat-like protein n=1 Tax=Mytilinidion resinicola TaxID=574789 RepID=A0A6A6YSD2_9PEZI|nr:uncharacterized protein BDZ99DRAFT_462176 [Mytilinidion resinicola]KAF2810875.1 hypothetical protein BDZ99DRAFT_462176 [Mytilinidion resinicola]
MDGQEIPGFYWDPDKKKYFAILATHKGPRPESQYSKDNIENVTKKSKIQIRREDWEKRMKTERVERSKTHQSPLNAVCLKRELGLQRPLVRHKDPEADAFVGGLEATVLGLPSHSTSRILFFDVDPITKTVYTAKADRTIECFGLKSESAPNTNHPRFAQTAKLPHGTDLGTWILADFERLVHSSTQNTTELPDVEHPYRRYHKGHRLHCLTSEVSSMSICHHARTLVTTSMGSDRNACIHLSSLDHAVGISETFTPRESRTIWTAAPSPSSSDNHPPIVAVAESNAVRILTLSPAGGWQSSLGFETSTDARALAWLSPTTLAVGLRDGTVHLYDPRSGRTGLCLNHPRSIQNLRRADDPTRIVVSGGQLLLYDLRMTMGRADIRTRRKRKRQNRGLYTVRVPSVPVLKFDHSFPPTDRQALDVHSELGLVAAGRDDASICLYSLKTGDLIKSFTPARTDFHHDSFLRFMDDERGVPKIMSTRGQDIVELAW